MGNKHSRECKCKQCEGNDSDTMLYEDAQSPSIYSLQNFPNYIYDDMSMNNLLAWWFESEFCQSRYGKDCKSGTNSCTLIVILTASKIAYNKVETYGNCNDVPQLLVEAFGQAILQANSIYASLEQGGKIKNVNFNIPEAMEILGDNLRRSSLQEWFFVHVHIPVNDAYKRTAANKLYTAIKDGLQMWHMLDFRKDYIFVILIADSRSILLCFQFANKVATLFDSHSHAGFDNGRGAVIVQTQWKHLQNLTFWIAEMFISIYQVQPKVFELSFLPLKK